MEWRASLPAGLMASCICGTVDDFQAPFIPVDSRVFPVMFHVLAGRDEKKPSLSPSGGLMLGMGMGLSPNPPHEWKRLKTDWSKVKKRWGLGEGNTLLPINID